jgi:hypothetical protein
MTSIPLTVIHLRADRRTAESTHQVYLNKNPDFQREYEAWDDKLKTRFIDTILSGRAMNPIWTVCNPEDKSEEILDGMHRITTALDYFTNKFALKEKFFTDAERGKKYGNKKFDDLSDDDKNNIRKYNFTFNQVDSSYKTDGAKLRDLYEILNRSSRTLNDFEFDKVIYNPFFSIFSSHKTELNNLFFNMEDKRGAIETEIINIFIASNEMPKYWSSLSEVRKDFYKFNLGMTPESVDEYLKKNKKLIDESLSFMKKVILCLKDNKFFSSERRKFNALFLPYKLIISRLMYAFKDISTFNRYIVEIIRNLKLNITDVENLQKKLECTTRNATFQRKLIDLIDTIVNRVIEINKDNRLFSKKTLKIN